MTTKEKGTMPPLPETTKLAPPPEWAIELASKVSRLQASVDDLNSAQAGMRDDICTHLHKIEERTKVLENEVTTVTGSHKAFTEETSEKLRQHSDRVKEPSQHDLAAQAAIAADKVRIENIEKELGEVKTEVGAIKTATTEQTTMLEANNEMTEAIQKSVTGYLNKHPNVIGVVLGAVITLVLAVLGAATAWVQRGPAPPPAAVYVTPAPAPTVSVIHPAVQP